MSKEYMNTLTKSLLFFYLFIASNFTTDLYAGQLKDFVKQSRLAQHVIGFVTMLVIAINVSDVKKPQKAIINAMIAYLFFVLSTKLDLQWNLAVILLLSVGYIYETILSNNEQAANDDQALNDENRTKIKNKNNQKKMIIIAVISIIVILGAVNYFDKKKRTIS